MNTICKSNEFAPSFGIRTVGITTVKDSIKSNVIQNAFKELAKKFHEITEVGRFEKIKVEIREPLKDSAINKTFLVIEPSANKNDFRTRVLSFVAFNPENENVKRSVAQATGNKFAIDSVLNSSKTVTAFKNFVKESERFFTSTL